METRDSTADSKLARRPHLHILYAGFFCAFLFPLAEGQASMAKQPDPVSDMLARDVTRPHPKSIDLESLRQKAAADPKWLFEVRDRATQMMKEPLPAEPRAGAGLPSGAAERAHAMLAIQNVSFNQGREMLYVAIAWLLTGDRSLLENAKQRAFNLASWAPTGVTGFRTHDQVGVALAWTLTLVFDLLHDQLGQDERAHLLAAIRSRMADILSSDAPYGLDNGRRLDRDPYDSHGAVTLARTAAMCAILAGNDPFYDECFRNIVPRYLARPTPWGGDDGGYANGTAYAHWVVADTHLLVWDILKQTIGIDLAQTPWAQGYGRFIAYFLPPGTPTGMFGDGAEEQLRADWAAQAKAYAARVPTPLADWYARQQFGENRSLSLLLAPWRDFGRVPGQLPAGTPNALYLPSIGWVAMHSDLGNRARTSVYFKSSPYGSFNHSHADQNSFVIHARGRVLAIDSGYYDYYNSPHWKEWYKQTRAHNAITFDGGQGQMHDMMAAKGKIVRFETGAAFDIVTGDATLAYGGALRRAVRSMIYLRPDALLVFDALASDTPRTWEWNIHALSQMKEKGERAIEIEQDGVRLCVDILEAPEGAFSQTDRFTAEPNGKYPRQWHVRYASRAKTAKANFVALLDVDCRKPEVSLRREGGKRVVSLGGRQFVLEENGEVGVAP